MNEIEVNWTRGNKRNREKVVRYIKNNIEREREREVNTQKIVVGQLGQVASREHIGEGEEGLSRLVRCSQGGGGGGRGDKERGRGEGSQGERQSGGGGWLVGCFNSIQRTKEVGGGGARGMERREGGRERGRRPFDLLQQQQCVLLVLLLLQLLPALNLHSVAASVEVVCLLKDEHL